MNCIRYTTKNVAKVKNILKINSRISLINFKRANNNKRSKLMKKMRNHYMKLQSPTTNMSQEPSVEDLTKMLKKVVSKEKERKKARGCKKDCNIESEVWNHIGTEIKRT